jgi:phage-related protein
MPVVGQAIVTVRVRSNNLSRDIRDAVTDGFRGADGDIDRQGQLLGQRLNESMARAIREDRQIQESIRNNVGNGLQDDNRLRQAGARLNQQIADGVRTDRRLEQEMQNQARRGTNAIEREVNRNRPRLLNLFGRNGGDLAEKLGKEFNLGVGAARMGPAVVSALTLAAPSFLGAAAAVGVAGAGALTAALSSSLLTGGLLLAAFKSGAESLKPGIDAYSKLGTSLGVAVADGMAGGFNRSASILTDRLIGPLTPLLQRQGELLGGVFEHLAETLTIPENMSRITSILQTNERFIDRFDVGLQGLTSSFLTLFKASKPMIDLVGDRFAEFGQWAANALAAAEANGSLGIVMDKLTRLASALFDWIGKLGPAVGNWLMNLDVDRIIGLWQSFGRVLGGIFDLFGEIAAGAGPILPQILDNIAAVLSNMVDSGVVETFARHVATLLEKLTGLIALLSDNPIAAQVLAFGVAWLLLGRIFSPIITLVTALAGSISGVGLAIAAVVGFFVLIYSVSEDFRNSLSELAGTLQRVFIDIWDQIQPRVEGLWDAIVRLAEAIGNALAPLIRALGPLFEALGPIIGAILVVIIEVLTLIANFLYGLITNDWGPFIEQISKLWSEFVAFLQLKWDEFVQWFAGIWPMILAYLYAAWESILSWLQMQWDTIVAAFHAIWDPIQAWWVSLWYSVSSTFQMIWEGIVAAAQAVWSAIVTTFHFFWDPIVTAWNTIWLAVSTVFQVVWSWILGAATAVWTGMTIAFHAIWDPIVAWWTNLWNNVSTAAQVIWNAIASTASTAWNTISAAITGIVSTLAAVLEGWWNTISAAVSIAWNGLSSTVSGIWEGIKNAIISPIQTAYEVLTGIISSITGAIQSAWEFVTGKATEISSALDKALADQAAAGAVTANIFNADAVAPPPPAALAALAGLTALATGGVVTRPTIALVGERGRERVEPLDSQGLSSRDRALITQIVGSMAGGATSGGRGDTLVQVQIGDQQIGGFIGSVVDDRNDLMARQISRRRRR